MKNISQFIFKNYSKDFYGKIFSLNYHHELIYNFAKSSILGSFALNIIASTIIVILLHNYFPIVYILIFIILNFILFYFRLTTSKKLILAKNDSYDKKYLKISLISISISSALFITVLFSSVFLHVENIKIMVLSFIIIALVAGGIGTLGNILVAFLLYTLSNLIPLVFIMLYIGGEEFNILAIVFSSFIFFISYQVLDILGH